MVWVVMATTDGLTLVTTSAMLGRIGNGLLAWGIVQVGAIVAVEVGDEVGVEVVGEAGSRLQPILRVRLRTRMKVRADISILFINFILTYPLLRNN
jgi:hypothetical protein